MTIGRTRVSILVVGMLTVVLTAPHAHAALSEVQKDCFKAIAKASLGFVKGKSKLLQKCQNAKLKDDSCMTPDPEALTKLEDKLLAGIDKGCTIPQGNFPLMGFPGPCTDANPGDGFTQSDLRDCIKASHEDVIDEIFALEYDPTVVGPLGSDDLACQKEVAKRSGALAECVLKKVQKCRNDIMKGKPLGVPPDLCATDHDKTSAAIAKCKDKLTSGIAGKCTNPQIVSLKVCDDTPTDPATAATCLIDKITVRIDGPEIVVVPDLIDYEYAVRGGLCGDNVVNSLNEECDGLDDSACMGQCGTAATPDGYFACLCKTKPRMVVIETSEADTDNGWTGLQSDGSVPEGGGYLLDLYDCDGGGLCNVGPSCFLPPHLPCSVPANAASGTTANSLCPGVGNFCRKERTATGPHCFQDINKKCNQNNPLDPVCNLPGDYCATTPHGAPVAAAAGGVAVCNVSVLSEDIVGTVNIQDGTSAVRVHQRAITWNAISQHKPCPVCGGFCGVSRERCVVDGDCPLDTGPCVTAAVCSDGPRQDKTCRRTPPFGGGIPFFGVTSIDCPPGATVSQLTEGAGLDIDINPRTTGTVTLLPTHPCTGTGFTNKTCLGGTSQGRPCTVDSECPASTCSHQCFCAGQLRPNACDEACVGGMNDGQGCGNDSECDPPNGFCHPADCRLDPSDLDSNQEGICTSGSPSTRYCSITSYRTCTNNDAQCRPPSCAFCQPSETCEPPTVRACSINSGIIRQGVPRTPNPSGVGKSGGAYCVPANGSAINTSAGFPGQGALLQQEQVIVVGVP